MKRTVCLARFVPFFRPCGLVLAAAFLFLLSSGFAHAEDAAAGADSATAVSAAAAENVSAPDAASAPREVEAPPAVSCDPVPADFTPYERPGMVASPFRAWTLRVADIGVFCGLLAVGTWVVLTRRRRVWFFGLLLVSAAYLGFFRHGCICSVGSIGNVAQAVSLEAKAVLNPPPGGIIVPAAPLRVGANGILEPAPAAEETPAPPPCRNGILSMEAVVFFILPLLMTASTMFQTCV